MKLADVLFVLSCPVTVICCKQLVAIPHDYFHNGRAMGPLKVKATLLPEDQREADTITEKRQRKNFIGTVSNKPIAVRKIGLLSCCSAFSYGLVKKKLKKKHEVNESKHV